METQPGVCSSGLSIGPDLQLDAAGVHRLGQRDVAPVEAGLAHVDGDLVVAGAR